MIKVDEDMVFCQPNGLSFVVVDVYDDGTGDVAGDIIGLDNPLFPLGYIDQIRPAELMQCEYLGTLAQVIAKATNAFAR